jgi:hypothetical protein
MATFGPHEGDVLASKEVHRTEVVNGELARWIGRRAYLYDKARTSYATGWPSSDLYRPGDERVLFTAEQRLRVLQTRASGEVNGC